MDAAIDSPRDLKRFRLCDPADIDDDDDFGFADTLLQIIVANSIPIPNSTPNPISIPIPANVPCKQKYCYGQCIWEIFSAKLKLNSLPESEEVRIYGAIEVWSHEEKDYLFWRKKEDAQVFKNPGKELTLALQGPVRPCVLDCGRFFSMFCGLKFNDKTIFPTEEDPMKCLLKKNYTQEPDLFGEEGGVGTGFLMLHIGIEWGRVDEFYNVSFEYPWPCLPIVSSLDMELGVVRRGVVASLKFTVSRDLHLFGLIAVRSSHWSKTKWIELFNKETGKEAVEVKSQSQEKGMIPLSRSALSTSCGSSLIIKAQLFQFDGNHHHYPKIIPLLNEEFIFSHVSCSSSSKTEEMSVANGLIKVEGTWWCRF